MQMTSRKRSRSSESDTDDASSVSSVNSEKPKSRQAQLLEYDMNRLVEFWPGIGLVSVCGANWADHHVVCSDFR